MHPDDNALPIRQNPRRLPSSMGLRTEPKLTPEDFAFRGAFRSLPTERGIVRPGPVTPKIVSSAHGPIRHMLLTYPSYADGDYSYKDVYADLFRQLPTFTRFTVLSHPDVIEELQEILRDADAEDRATIVEAPDYLHFLVWAEDPYVVVHDVALDPPKVFLIEPYVFPRVGDAAIPDLVADATEVQSIQSPLYFQGGNVLIGDDFVLIGADYPANTIQHINDNGQIIVPPDADVGEFVNALYRRTFDPEREVIYVGTRLVVPQTERREITVNGERWQEIVYLGTGRAQPIFHIDMFISLAGRGPDGRYRAFVGSPQVADRLLGRATVPHAMAPIFDDVARHLEREGFDVMRNPLPLTYVDDPASRTRVWYFATSNNCLVQIDEDTGNAVWLPTYGHGPWEDLRETDEANRRIWAGMGFTVHQLTDFNPFAQNLGSVHCIKKYLER